MMNKLIGVSLLCLSLSFPAQADDRLTLAEIYQTVQDEYLEPVSLNEIAMPALQGLNKLDKRVRIADDDRRVSVYVNGRVMLSRSKPEDPHDVSAWVKFTQDIIRSAQKASPELKRKDFEIIDTMMAHGIKKFDRDSSYYPDLELSNPPVPEFKPKRAFYGRLLENDVLYMRLGAINKYTGENVSRSLTEHSGVKGLIIDLRGNPGGMLQEAVRVAGLFIDGGIVASSKGRSPDSTEYYNAPAGDVLDNKPIVVLIDGQTASSAEVLAAALQEQSRAVVVGTGSYGKGTVQKLIKLSNDSRLALTNGIIYTPSGNKLAGIGVLPDICTSGEPETRDAEKIIARGSRSNACLPENRMKSELDLSVAEAYLRKHIK